MFRKLISNLPFNPSLIGEVAFYYSRLRREEQLRRLGIVFIVLSFFIQSFAVFSPPQSTLAESDNDIIRGGFQNRDQAILNCIDTNKDFATILNYYRVTCDILANASTTTLRSTAHNKQLDSMGRQRKGDVITRTGKPTNEYPVGIGGTTYFMRNLWAFDSGSYSDYKVLEMTNLDGQKIFIMYDCGNIVTVGKYTPPATPTPTPEPTNRVPAMNFSANCSAVSWKASDPDGSPRIRIYVAKNSGNAGSDWSNKGPFVHTIHAKSSGTTNDGSWTVPDSYKNTTDSFRVFGVVSDRLPGGQTDDVNFVRASPSSGIVFGPCAEEPTPPPPPTPTTPTPTQEPVDVCPNKPGTQYDLSDCDVCPDVAGIQYRYSDCDVCPNVPEVQTSPNQCYPCPEAENVTATTACLELDKTAANLTQDIDDADGTQANASDTIAYTLSVHNKGTQPVADFIIEEDMVDVLQYATLVDTGGGELNDDRTLIWPRETIAPGQTITKIILVKVKDPIPNTPISVSDTTAFDLVMTNTFYGSSVNITLPKSVSKTAETITRTLPKTGPTESMLAVVGITMFVSYFLARAYLLKKETKLVRVQFASGNN